MRVRRWAALALMSATACSSAGSNASGRHDRSFVRFQPVVQQVAPGGCHAPEVPKRDAAGNVTACYVLGPGAVDGNAVASAQAERDTTNGEWQIEFALTPQGTAAWNAMAARVGQGNQIAIVVDGAVASAPTLDTTDFPGRGAITGDYTQAQAEALAKRLSPG